MLKFEEVVRMELPAKIKIGGLVYRVSTDNALGRDRNRLGESSGNDLTIAIDSSIPRQNKESVILHEVLEQINYRYELCLDHEKITVLETALYQVMKDNPSFMEFMLSEI
jgi:predicted heme/steroid binding protein